MTDVPRDLERQEMDALALLEREARDELSRARINPARLTRGTRYQWDRGRFHSAGVFLRYEISGDDPVAIFRDFSPRTYMDWTETTQVVIGLSWLIDCDIEEVNT